MTTELWLLAGAIFGRLEEKGGAHAPKGSLQNWTTLLKADQFFLTEDSKHIRKSIPTALPSWHGYQVQ